MTIRVGAEVELDDVFEALDDDDLLAEVKRRGYFLAGDGIHAYTFVYEAIHYLKERGVPQSLIDQLTGWALQPVANKEALEGWLKMCGIGGPR
jgi:hypothetical protein